MPVKLSLNRSRQVPAENTPAFGGIAERFRRAGDLDRAITLCREGLRRFPDLLSARVTLGWALLDKGEYDEARKELEFVIRRAPDNLAAIRGLAELHDRADSAPIETPASWQHEEAEAAAAAPDMAAVGPSVPAPVEPAAPISVAPIQPPLVSPLPLSGAELSIDPTPDIARVEIESPLAAYLDPVPGAAAAVEELDPVLPPQSQWELDPPLAPAADLMADPGQPEGDLGLDPVVSLPATEDLGLDALATQFADPPAADRAEARELDLAPLPATFAGIVSEFDAAPAEDASSAASSAVVERSEGLPLIPFRPMATLAGVAGSESDARIERWGALVVPIAPRSANRHTLASLERLLRKIERRRQSTSGSVA